MVFIRHNRKLISMEDAEKIIPKLSDGNSPTIYIDGFQGIAISNNVARVNFYEDRFIPGPEGKKGHIERHIVVRLAMPEQVLESVNGALTQLIAENKDNE